MIGVCGIAALFAKNDEVEASLGELLAGMLVTLGERGPDSTGFAVYGDPVGPGWSKLSVRGRHGAPDWTAVAEELAGSFGDARVIDAVGGHAVVAVQGDSASVAGRVRESRPDLQVVSSGTSIEMFKEVGLPADVIDLFSLTSRSGSHGLGHTRMGTESRITTDGSHPFSTGPDMCLVHNGSLSNHNRLRQDLRRHGISFETENDSEVAAGYLTLRLSEGDTLDAALESCLTALDGFYTFAVGTLDGFAVLRDPIACKPAVLAETDSWVAMASEYRAIANLPGAEDATVWEPAPGQVYHWARAKVA